MTSDVHRRLFPRGPTRRLTEIPPEAFAKLGGKCHHKKNDPAPDLEIFKAEAADCIRDFGNCWRKVTDPGEVEE